MTTRPLHPLRHSLALVLALMVTAGIFSVVLVLPAHAHTAGTSHARATDQGAPARKPLDIRLPVNIASRVSDGMTEREVTPQGEVLEHRTFSRPLGDGTVELRTVTRQRNAPPTAGLGLGSGINHGIARDRTAPGRANSNVGRPGSNANNVDSFGISYRWQSD